MISIKKPALAGFFCFIESETSMRFICHQFSLHPDKSGRYLQGRPTDLSKFHVFKFLKRKG